MRKVKSWLKFLMAFCFLLGIALACDIIPPEPELPHSEYDGMYSYKENTILESLRKRNLEVFTPIPEVPSPQIPSTTGLSQMNFIELLDLGESFHQWKWMEPVNNWNLFEIQYQVACDGTEQGPSFLGVTVFKISNIQEKEVRLVHKVLIGHPPGTIYWFESERYPVNENWPVFNFSNIDAVVAENALRVGEENGGRKVRLAVGNNCVIYIVFAPYLSTNDWVVRYFQSAGSSAEQHYLLELYVDQTSGGFNTIQPK